MTYTVYGIRLKGDRETRYVGFTKLTLEKRLAEHLARPIISYENRPVLPWLKENRADVEIFVIEECETEAEARAAEGRVIKMCLRMNQRLLNCAQVPPHLWLEVA